MCFDCEPLWSQSPPVGGRAHRRTSSADPVRQQQHLKVSLETSGVLVLLLLYHGCFHVILSVCHRFCRQEIEDSVCHLIQKYRNQGNVKAARQITPQVCFCPCPYSKSLWGL